MCAFCGVPATVHEDMIAPLVNSTVMTSPWLLAKGRWLARLPAKLVDAFVETVLRM